MDNPRQITTIQAASILISTIIGVGVLPLPLFAVRGAGTGAPLLTLLAALLALVGLIILTKLGQRFPRRTIVEYSQDLIGKWPARIGALLIILFFAELTALASREFGEVVVTTVLRRTPLDVSVIVMIVLAALSARSSITVFGYIHQFYVPFVLFPALLIFALSLKNANPLYIQPFWGQGDDYSRAFRDMIMITTLFNGAFVMTMVIPAMRNPKRAMKSALWGMLIAGGFYVLTVAATVAVFGPEETLLLLWPTLELAKVTSLPANVLERLDAAFLAVWVTAVFTTLYSTYYFTIHSTSKLLGLKDHKFLAMGMMPFIFVLAMLPQNVLDMYYIILSVGRVGLVLTIVYPLLLLIIALIRKKGGDDDGRGRSIRKESAERKPKPA